MRFVEKDWTTAMIRRKKSVRGGVFVVVLILLIIAIASLLWIGNARLNTAIDHSEQSNLALAKKLEQYQQKLTHVQNNYVDLREDTAIHDMTHQIEDYLATDDFVVNKVYFYKDTSHHLDYLYIDIYNQPSMEASYSAQGVYTLPDQQLKVKCEQMITDVQDYYGEGEFLPTWNKDTVVYLTINNYEIGNNTNGKFELTAKLNNRNP